MDLKQFTRLKNRLATLERETSQAEGRLEQLMKELKEKYGVDSIEAAVGLIAEMKKEAEEQEEVYNTSMEELMDSFGDLLGR